MIFSLTPDIPTFTGVSKAHLLSYVAELDQSIAKLQARAVTDARLLEIREEVLQLVADIYGVTKDFVRMVIGAGIDGPTVLGQTNAWLPSTPLVSTYRTGPTIWSGIMAADQYYMANECYYPNGTFDSATSLGYEAKFAMLECYRNQTIPTAVLDSAFTVTKTLAILGRMLSSEGSYAQMAYSQRGFTSYTAFSGTTGTYYYKSGSYGQYHQSSSYCYVYHLQSMALYKNFYRRFRVWDGTYTQDVLHTPNYASVDIREMPEYATFVAKLDTYWGLNSQFVASKEIFARKQDAVISVLWFLRGYAATHTSSVDSNIGTALLERLSSIVGVNAYRVAGEQIVLDQATGRYKRVHPDGKVLQKSGGDYHAIFSVLENSAPANRIPINQLVYKMDRMTNLDDFIAFRVAHPEVTYVRYNGNAYSGCTDSAGWMFTGPNNPAPVTSSGRLLFTGLISPDTTWSYRLAGQTDWVPSEEPSALTLPEGVYGKGTVILKLLIPQYYEGNVYAVAERYIYNLVDITILASHPTEATPLMERAVYFSPVDADTFDEITGKYSRTPKGTAFSSAYNGAAFSLLIDTLPNYCQKIIDNIDSYRARDTYGDIGGVSVYWTEIPEAIDNALLAYRAALVLMREEAIAYYYTNPAALAVLNPIFDLVDFYYAGSKFSPTAGGQITTALLQSSLPSTEVVLDPFPYMADSVSAYRSASEQLWDALALEGPILPTGPAGYSALGDYTGWFLPTVESLYGSAIVAQESINVFARYYRRLPDLPVSTGYVDASIEFFQWRAAASTLMLECFDELYALSTESLTILAQEEAAIAELRAIWFSRYLLLPPEATVERNIHNGIGAFYGVSGTPVLSSYQNAATGRKPQMQAYVAVVNEERAKEKRILTDIPSVVDAPIIEQLNILATAVSSPEYQAVSTIHRPDAVTGEYRYVNYYTYFAAKLASVYYMNKISIVEDSIPIAARLRALSSIFVPEEEDAWLPMCEKYAGGYIYTKYASDVDPEYDKQAATELAVRPKLEALLDSFITHNLDPYAALFGVIPTSTSSEGDEIMSGIQALDPSSPYYPVSQWYSVDCFALVGTTSYEWMNVSYSQLGGAGFLLPVWKGYRWLDFHIPYIMDRQHNIYQFYWFEVKPGFFNLLPKNYDYWMDYHTYYEQFIVPSRNRAIQELPGVLAARQSLVEYINTL